MTGLISRPILGARHAAMLRQDREMTTTPVSWSVERARMFPGLRWVNDNCGNPAITMDSLLQTVPNLLETVGNG